MLCRCCRIGLAIAERLGHDGAHVVVSSRKQKNVDRAVEGLRAKDISVTGVTCHVGDADARRNLVEHVSECRSNRDYICRQGRGGAEGEGHPRDRGGVSRRRRRRPQEPRRTCE